MAKKTNPAFERFKGVLADDTYGLMPAPLSAQEAIDILRCGLLGDDYYVSVPMHVEQCNTVIVYDILNKHCKEFRKYMKKNQRELIIQAVKMKLGLKEKNDVKD